MAPVAIGDTQGTLQARKTFKTVCKCPEPLLRVYMKFHKVKDLTYETIPLHGEPDIIHAKHIMIEERISALSTLVRKSVRDFPNQMKKYAADVTEHAK